MTYALDKKGDLAIMITGGGGGGMFSASFHGIFGIFPDAPDVYALEGFSNQTGVSGGEILSGGFDVINARNSDGKVYTGYVFGAGVGGRVPIPWEFHTINTHTEILLVFNTYDVMEIIYHAIVEW